MSWPSISSVHWSLRWGICIILATMGWLFMRGVPPMQSPDEPQHIARAYMLGQSHFTLSVLPGKMSGGAVDGALVDYINLYSRLAGQPQARISEKDQRAGNALAWRSPDQSSFFEVPGTGYYLPFVYIPHALGLRGGEFFGLSIADSYQLARFTVILSCLLILGWAFALQRPSPLAVAFLLLPMGIFQGLLPTLDGFTTSLALLAISLFLWIWRRDDAPPGWAIGSLGACIFLVVTSRMHLLPMLALPLMIFWRWRQTRDLWVGLALMLMAAGWLMYALTSTVDWRIARAHGTGELVIHYVQAPWKFFEVLGRTLGSSDLLAFYARSFIGVLGWLEAPLKPFFYPWIGAGLLACMLLSMGRGVLPRSVGQGQLGLSVIAVLSVLLAFFALLVTWTPHPAEVVNGMQGRYFLVPALLLAYSVARLDRSKSRLRRWLNRGIICIFASLCLVALAIAMKDRYCPNAMQYSLAPGLNFALALDPLQSCPSPLH